MKYNSQNMEIARKALVEYSYYQSVLDLFEYDGWQTLPKNGQIFRENTAAYISQQASAILRSREIRDAAAAFREIGFCDPEAYATRTDFAVARRLVRLVNRVERVPADLDAAFVKMALRNQQIWREARAAADFDQYRPYMKELFELRKRIAQALDPDRPPYQVMVDMFDQGLDISEVSRLFDSLKQSIPELLHRVDPCFTAQPVPADFSCIQDRSRMARVVQAVLKQTDMNTENACFAEILHPICYSIGPKDVRITLNYDSNIWKLLLSAMHECGHGRYSYSSSEEAASVGLWGAIDGAMNEGVARFYENMIGRSLPFLHFAYPFVVQEFPEFKKYSIEQIYHTINHVCPGSRRITADELSYSLHPIIRFEMEKDYFEGKTSIDDFREIWNEKYRHYLGVVPENDREGILQDISWSSGYLGYFQSYTLGNLYGAQLRATMLQQIPDACLRVEHGDFSAINGWMSSNLFRHGKTLTGSEAISQITGRGLQTEDFLSYLSVKYTNAADR